MRILVLNGSPKGKYSITLQTALYLEKAFPSHQFDILHVSQRIRTLEKDMAEVLESIRQADLLLFAYPVYTFIAPSQLHRFFELLKASGEDFSSKYATQITTSKKFYDVTAHRYVQDNCQDLKMKFIRGLSADMDDLLGERGRCDAQAFLNHVLFCVQNALYLPQPALQKPFVPMPVLIPVPDERRKHGDVVIITDCAPENTQLDRMIKRFCAVSDRATRIINLRDYPFKGGCLGCFHCAVSGKCVYADGFDEYLRTQIQSGEAIVYAFTIRDHSMGALFKTYDDRQFCNGHRTVTMGMPVGYLISGPYESEINLQTIVEARAQVGGNFLAGVATDERDPNAAIDRMAMELSYALDRKYVPPQNFYGVGGMKIFRDLIWLMQGMMRADHKFYKKHKQYDFPQKKLGTMLKMYLVGALISSTKVQAKMGNMMNEGMLAPYKKILNK